MRTRIFALNATESEAGASGQAMEQTASPPERGERSTAHQDAALKRTARRKGWAIAGGAVIAVAIVYVSVFVSKPVTNHEQMFVPSEPDPAQRMNANGALMTEANKPEAVETRAFDAPMAPAPQAMPSKAMAANGPAAPLKGKGIAAARQGPMIARTVSLTVLAKDFPAARPALDAILARHRGYSASLTVNTPSSGPGSFQASLRVPAEEITTALSELKALGRVVSEAQAGEEVTEQHADLMARLENAREEEARLRAILEQRTGKIEDVLQVEEEIARVRGEIESMEAQQKALEHRVDYVTVDLQLLGEYREQLTPAGMPAGKRMRNAMIAGLRKAGGTVLGIALFLEEFGPSIVIWLAILGTPVFFAARHYLRQQERPNGADGSRTSR